LIFEVELFAFQDKQKEKWELQLHEKMQKAAEYKALGTEKFRAQDFNAALFEGFLEGLSYIEEEPLDEEEVNEIGKELKDLKIALNNNVALCASKIGNWELVVSHSTNVIEIEP
jgi:hypothetical protein